MKFNTKYLNEKAPKEKNSGEHLIEKAGYISAEQRITNLMSAGQRLVQSRQNAYDFPDGKIDFSYNDPTRRKGFDMADAFQLGETARLNLKASQTVPKAPMTASEVQTDVEPGKTE